MKSTTVGERISHLLKERKLMQKDLALAVGVQTNITSYWCRSIRVPNIEQLAKIALFLGTTTDYLLGLTDIENANMDLLSICRTTKLSEESISNLLRLLNDEEEDSTQVVNAFLSSGKSLSRLTSAVNAIMMECEQARDCLEDGSTYDSELARDFQRGKVIDRMELSFFKADEAFRDAINKTFGYRQLIDELRNI